MGDPVRPLVMIAGVEAVAALVLAGAIAVSAGGSDLGSRAGLLTVAIWGVLVVALALIGWGLHRRSALARTPFLLAQAFALMAALPILQSDLATSQFGGVLLAGLAAAGLLLGLRPAARTVLG